MSFFSNLRRVNRTYPNAAQFPNIDNLNLVQTAPTGFRNVFSAPSTRQLADNIFEPGYRLANNEFVSTATINSILRNNDVSSIRNVFTNATNAQINSMSQLRRFDNIPDAGIHSRQMRQDAVRRNFPETNTRTPEGIQNALNQHPQLNNRLTNLKAIGTPILLGVGIYLIWSAASLIQDIINALNRVGGSYYIVGQNGGDTAQACLLLHRTCAPPPNITDTAVNICERDPLIQDQAQLLNICQGFNIDTEKTVCRASDPNADPTSRQYVDISDLATGQTITCIEPYNLADLISDLGLDNLLGPNGVINRSSDKSSDSFDSLLPVIWIIGIVIFVMLIAYFIFRRMMNRQTVRIER